MVKALRQLRYFQWNSGIARTLLSLFYQEGKWYPIPFGSLRGVRIHYDREVNYHAILGFWEVEHFALLKKHLFKGPNRPKVVADVGANIGMYAIWFSRQMNGGVVHAFEPAPYSLKKLNEHISENGIQNIKVVSAACADKKGKVTFFIGHHHHSSSMLEYWAGGGQKEPEKIEVPAITLDEYFTEGGFEFPDLIKMDIEGGAVFALKGCKKIATEKRPFVFIECHNPNEDKAVGEFCLEFGYEAYQISERRWVKDLSSSYPNPEGIFGNLFLTPKEKKSALHLL